MLNFVINMITVKNTKIFNLSLRSLKNSDVTLQKATKKYTQVVAVGQLG